MHFTIPIFYKKTLGTLFLSTLLVLSFFNTQAQTTLNLCKQTESIKFYYTQQDAIIIDEMINISEQLLSQIEIAFNHRYSKQIKIQVYPDLTSFHHAINFDDAPYWVIGQTTNHNHKMVSPINPGPLHSYKSVIKSYHTGLIELFICDKYQNHESIPRWLHQGVALYKAQMTSERKLLSLPDDQLPTLQQLENTSKEDGLKFAALHGFATSYSLVKFIDTNWGWPTILALLEDYSSFEKTLNLSRDDFMIQWKNYLKK